MVSSNDAPAVVGLAGAPGAGVLRFIPLGGLGEIGKNLALLECGNDVVVIDAGLSFPDLEMVGVDVVLPDISYLLTRKDRLRAVLLTHGHEDHIGALPFYLGDFSVPIYGTGFTLGLLRNKLERRGLRGQPELHEVQPGETVRVGALTAEFIQMTHSVPGSCGLAINTPAGMVIHTGDFKLDQTPVGGAPPDLARLAELGRRGVRLLLSDSTNAPNEGITPSELSVRPALDAALRDCEGRVIVVTFASNLARLRQIVELAAANGRRSCLVGRSMLRNVATAMELGYLKQPPGGLLAPRDLSGLADQEVCLLATGSQGEPLAALSRIASGTHPFVRVRPKDTVVLAANPIPGNEATVSRVVNLLVEQGVRILAGSRDGVHASGHGAREELRFMLELIRPQFFAPVHGEPRHLDAHRRIAAASGMGTEQVAVLENGSVLEVSSDRMRVAGSVRVGAVLVDSDGRIEGRSRTRRRGAEEEVVVTISLTIDRRLRTLIEGPHARALVSTVDPYQRRLLDEGCEAIKLAIRNHRPGFHHEADLRDTLQAVMDSHLAAQGSWRPTVVPIVTLA
ncbi:MAG: ribonuclease J [Candidatus Dormibacteria bacterium]